MLKDTVILRKLMCLSRNPETSQKQYPYKNPPVLETETRALKKLAGQGRPLSFRC